VKVGFLNKVIACEMSFLLLFLLFKMIMKNYFNL